MYKAEVSIHRIVQKSPQPNFRASSFLKGTLLSLNSIPPFLRSQTTTTVVSILSCHPVHSLCKWSYVIDGIILFLSPRMYF